MNEGASQYAMQRWGFGSLCCLAALMMSIPFINCYAVAQVPARARIEGSELGRPFCGVGCVKTC